MVNEAYSRRYWVDAWSDKVGVKFMAAEVNGISVRKALPSLEAAKKRTLEQIAGTSIDTQPILQGYRDLFISLGIEGAVSSPEWLHKLIISHGHLPLINSVVDAYNDVSARTFVVISAHDLRHVRGDVRIEQTTGSEVFFPLGSKEPETLQAGEWAGKADDHVLCRLNCKQSELSKVTFGTKDLLVYAQGNRVTTADYLQQVLIDACTQIVDFNGGRYHLLEELRAHDQRS